MKVLLVEDNEITRRLTAGFLEAAGHKVVQAGCAEEVDWTSSSSKPIPEVAVIDVCLPGMNGVALLRRMRASPGWESVPVVLVTALPVSSGSGDELALYHPAVLLSKPYEPEELLRLLQATQPIPS